MSWARADAAAPALRRAVDGPRSGLRRGALVELSHRLVVPGAAIAARRLLLGHGVARDLRRLLLGILLGLVAQRQLDVLDRRLARGQLTPALDLGVELLSEEDRDV